LETQTLIGAQVYQPVADPLELRMLATRYGNPIYRCYDIETDEHLRHHRWQDQPDRRGEVVFVIRQPNGEILLHTKSQYNQDIYRLPSGGIHNDEAVEDALYREIAEETGQPVVLHRFLALLNCRFHLNGDSVSFASYVFYLESPTTELKGADPTEIAAFRTAPPEELAQVARALRSLNGKRRQWGYWRSLSHDLTYQFLLCPDEIFR
jgi:8-oxo-dGTP diphosphatase